MTFKDHFSGHAQRYAEARPTYPDELFSYLKEVSNDHKTAWDCATGNGQAAAALAPFFEKVLATDASNEQIQQARQCVNIDYQVMAAENPSIEDSSIDLITVAQAIHWFDIDKFFAAAERVLKPGGILAVWSYGLHEINQLCDEVTTYLYSDIVGKYWPSERCFVEKRYEDIQFPMSKIEAPAFDMRCQWSVDDVLNYYGSWSAVQRYIAENGTSPIELIKADFKAAWGEEEVRSVRWPLALFVNRNRA
jgi:SAM-dependent methyltransferase